MDIADCVNEDRLRADIERNGEFGAVDGAGHGRTNQTGSEANREARDYLVARMEDAGLTVRIDAVGTIIGRWTPADGTSDAAPVASGSHLDSVPKGGIFDGPLGVYAALEAVRAMQDAGTAPERPIEVVSFTEEEGSTFAPSLLGSSVAIGERSVDEALALTDSDGRTLEEALSSIGFAGEGRLDASAWNAWLELHVEQHTELERTGIKVGIVTDVTGITHCGTTIVGEANHAGSTPMGQDHRTDALAAAAEVILAVEDAAERQTGTDPNVVGTVGSLTVSPNATNVVPGQVELGLDIRSVTRASMNHLVDATQEVLKSVESSRGVTTTLTRKFDIRPMPMADRCQTALRSAGARTDIETTTLQSGAAHDSMYIARVTDAGMLFAPSRNGVSHNPAEWTDWVDCADATRVLAVALADLAGV
jgi:N-carbamoyl-L-amino-acid hydrolase